MNARIHTHSLSPFLSPSLMHTPQPSDGGLEKEMQNPDSVQSECEVDTRTQCVLSFCHSPLLLGPEWTVTNSAVWAEEFRVHRTKAMSLGALHGHYIDLVAHKHDALAWRKSFQLSLSLSKRTCGRGITHIVFHIHINIYKYIHIYIYIYMSMYTYIYTY